MNEARRVTDRWSRGMRRRSLLGGLAAMPLVGIGSSFARTGAPTVGYIGFNTAEENAEPRNAIIDGLAEQGLAVSRNLRWIERHADSAPEQVEPMIRALMAEGADVIAASGAAVRRAITVIAGRVPVVYGFSGDPIAAGFADSLARPRGKATGVSLMTVEINAKRIELLKDMAPATRRIALLAHPNHPGEAAEVEVCRRTVAVLGIDLLYMPVHSAADIDKALAQGASAGVDAVVALPDSITSPNRWQIADWARAQRVPSASGWAIFAQSGAFMTFGPNRRDCYRRVGYLASRILAGADPADLPIEQPTRFELVVNLRTARAINLTLSEPMLARADELLD